MMPKKLRGLGPTGPSVMHHPGEHGRGPPRRHCAVEPVEGPRVATLPCLSGERVSLKQRNSVFVVVVTRQMVNPTIVVLKDTG
jgi:hypothetical protein